MTRQNGKENTYSTGVWKTNGIQHVKQEQSIENKRTNNCAFASKVDFPEQKAQSV